MENREIVRGIERDAAECRVILCPITKSGHRGVTAASNQDRNHAVFLSGPALISETCLGGG